ncbi:hypothetical protein M6B38_386910 [Iris pallida]|uniref:Uncharacterized protein n=1 Tax=Iris pallida TaxID=29817 RepID=A0AAX6G2A0_IRIPA|nr:hypothetical protein M6B38_386910 [Iris pallida]
MEQQAATASSFPTKRDDGTICFSDGPGGDVRVPLRRLKAVPPPSSARLSNPAHDHFERRLDGARLCVFSRR